MSTAPTALNNTQSTPATADASWLGRSRWGLMFHYLDKPASSNCASPTSAEDWNRRVDAFDVDAFAASVKASGAGYVIFTLGQNTGHYCAPNAAYDALLTTGGSTASRLSRRDLIAEIAAALLPQVQLIAYLPSHPPANHQEAALALGFTPGWGEAAKWGVKKFWPDAMDADARLSAMQRNWESVIACWGERWGNSVAGWWIDGCYFAEQMYGHADEPNFASLARALRSGNSERILALNPGTSTPFLRLCAEQDYTAGEVSTRLPAANKWEPLSNRVDGMQTHVLTYLGDWWGQGEPRFAPQLLQSYTASINAVGGAITWDVPIGNNGTIADSYRKLFDTLPNR